MKCVLLLLGIVHLVLVTTSPVCFYERTPQHALYGAVSFVLKSVSLADCRSNCTARQEECQSFNYNYNTDSCFMNNMTQSSGGDLGTHNDVDYFERVGTGLAKGGYGISKRAGTGTAKGWIRVQQMGGYGNSKRMDTGTVKGLVWLSAAILHLGCGS